MISDTRIREQEESERTLDSSLMRRARATATRGRARAAVDFGTEPPSFQRGKRYGAKSSKVSAMKGAAPRYAQSYVVPSSTYMEDACDYDQEVPEGDARKTKSDSHRSVSVLPMSWTALCSAMY